MATSQNKRPQDQYPLGATVRPGGVAFCVWAPGRRRVSVVLDDGTSHRLTTGRDGMAAGVVPGLTAGTRYRYQLDHDGPYPDPASRFQPDGPHGPSMVVDPSAFPWSDGDWRGVALDDAVIYEMHIGTFTGQGTWAAALEHLPALADLGITVLEVMPVADFPGRFGWGYDGVNLFAPCRLYGAPDDFRRFVDTAHRLGLAVLLDVVYNHFGPDGNYLKAFSPSYFTNRYKNEWGEPINFDGPDSGPVRTFFLCNAAAWITEYHLDGLRLDATQQIFDASPRSIVAEITATVRAAAPHRTTLVIGENEPQEVRLITAPDRGGHGLDALWNDDFHHSAIVAVTGHREAYYSDHLGHPQEFISVAKYGFLFQGQWYSWQQQRRGTPSLDLEPRRLVSFLENHDQVANSRCGARLHQVISADRWRAVTALLLLLPHTPMLFQGQEFATSAPFRYFADHTPELAAAILRGRTAFLRQFDRLRNPDTTADLPDPADPESFAACRLDHAERHRHGAAVGLHRDLLRLRREDAVLRHPRRLDGAVLGDEAFLLRYFGSVPGDDRLLLVNLGRDLALEPSPEPLLAPPRRDLCWRLAWSSEDPRYGGAGVPPPQHPGQISSAPGYATLVFVPEQEATR